MFTKEITTTTVDQAKIKIGQIYQKVTANKTEVLIVVSTTQKSVTFTLLDNLSKRICVSAQELANHGRDYVLCSIVPNTATKNDAEEKTLKSACACGGKCAEKKKVGAFNQHPPQKTKEIIFNMAKEFGDKAFLEHIISLMNDEKATLGAIADELIKKKAIAGVKKHYDLDFLVFDFPLNKTL